MNEDDVCANCSLPKPMCECPCKDSPNGEHKLKYHHKWPRTETDDEEPAHNECIHCDKEFPLEEDHRY